MTNCKKNYAVRSYLHGFTFKEAMKTTDTYKECAVKNLRVHFSL